MAINKIANGMKGLAVRNILNQVIDEVNSLSTLQPTSKFNVDAQTIANAMDNGVFNGAGSVKTLSQGWWVIPETNTQVTGRPSGSQGDLIYFTQDVGNGRQYAYGFALGKDKQGVDTMWVQYRDGTSWTAWWPIRNLTQLTPTGDVPNEIQQEIANLKQGEQNAIERIKLLETRLGGIFAPNQAAFDRAVMGLITPELNALEKKVEANAQEIRSVEALALTIEEVKKQLTADGWGPLPTSGTQPPVTKEVEFFALYGSNFPTTIGQLSSADTTVQLTRSVGSAARIFVAVKNDANQADRVVGISVDGGLQALWDHRDLDIEGEKYRIFFSPSAFYETTNSVKVNYR